MAQSGLFINGDDASFRVDSTSFLSVDGDLYNVNCNSTAYVRFNGPLYLSGSLINNDSLKFSATTGSGNSKKARIIFRSGLFIPTNTAGAVIGGSIAPVFWEVEFDKGTGNYLTLLNDVRCLDTVSFKTGLIYINGYKWKMIDPVGVPSVINHPYLKNEKHSCQFLPNNTNDTGLVIYKTIYTNSTYINPANIGIEFSGPLNIGSPIAIFRGFKQQVNAVKSSILRYYDIYSSGHSLVNNLVKIKYTYTDMNFNSVGYLNASNLTIYASPNSDMNWSQLPSVKQNTMIAVNSITLNGEMSANLSDLNLPNTTIMGEAFRITIADPNCPNPPVSGLLLDTIHICTGNTLVLDAGNNTAISNTSLKWEWNTVPAIYTKTLSVSPNTTHQKYKLKLIDVRGCITQDSVIIAPQAPYPQITYLNHLNACYGDSVIIKDTVKISSGTYSNLWQFSNSDTSHTLKQTFKKLFQSTGSHAYQLTATSNHGCLVTATSTNVIVYPLPTVSFTNSFDCSLGLMNFTNTSVSNYSTLIISSSNWNLGQGSTNTSTLFAPSSTYSSSGSYTIKLVSTSSFGCIDSVSSTITIHPSNLPSFFKNNSCLNDTVFFTNTSACNTGSCTYEWQFGDATSSFSLSPKKVYASAGLYIAKLKVTDPIGCPDSVSSTIFINPNPVAQLAIATSTVCLNEFVYFTNSSTISSGQISSYNWNFGNSSTSSSTNAVTSFSISGIYGVSLTAVSDSACTHTITQAITIPAQPLSQYTVNTVCFGNYSQFVSNSSGMGLSYLWDFGNSVLTSTVLNSSQNYLYSSPGNYNSQLIVIDVWGCSDTSMVTANVLSSPTAALGGSISTCGNSYTLNCGNAGANYLWLPGNQTSQYITAYSSGLYQVTITNTNGCIGTESVQLSLNAIVKPRLGNDTIVCGDFKINAGYPGSQYLWNTSATTQTLLTTTSGTYIVQVTDLNGCSGHDTIQVNLLTAAVIDLGSNINICKPKYGYTIVPITNATNLVWNDASFGTQLNVLTNGIYWCEATLSNGCKKRDSLTVNFQSTPKVDIGTDRSSCSQLVLDAQNFGSSYLWNTGETTQYISVDTSSNYFVLVTNTVTSCTQSDSVNIQVYPEVIVFLGNDTTVCDNTGFSLNANNSGALYNWTNGASTQSIVVQSSGIYGLTVTNLNGCFASDYIQINLTGAPNVELGSSTRYLCGNNPVTMSISNSGQIQWNSNIGTSTTSASISINAAGKYWVTVTENGCSATDSVLIVTTNNTIQASFLASSIDTINKPVKFVNLSRPTPVSQSWEFGDGMKSVDFSPVHTYVLPKNYSVTLEVSNGFCTDRITKELAALFKIQPPDIDLNLNGLQLKNFMVYPNPTTHFLNILFELSVSADINVQLLDVSGRVLVQENILSKTYFSPNIDISLLSNGIYVVNIKARSLQGNINKNVKFIKTN